MGKSSSLGILKDSMTKSGNSGTTAHTAEAQKEPVTAADLERFHEELKRLEMAAAALNHRVVLTRKRPQEWIDKQDRRFEKFKKAIFYMTWGRGLQKARKALLDFDFDGERLDEEETEAILDRPISDFIGVLAPPAGLG